MSQVSIIIPTFNRLYILQKVLASYLDQSSLLELIIVDDASTDGTTQYIQALNHPKINLITHAKNQGQPSAKNTGIHAATGDYIAFGEDDLFFDPRYIEILLKTMQAKDADIAAGRLVYLHENEPFESAQKRASNHHPYFNHWTLAGNYQKMDTDAFEVPFLHACALIKRPVASTLLYDTGYKVPALREETDFYLRAYASDYKLLFVPKTIVYHLPIDAIKTGGSWANGWLQYHYQAILNQFRFTKIHHKTLKQIGLKSPPFLFNLLHVLNRFRILYRSLRYQMTHRIYRGTPH